MNWQNLTKQLETEWRRLESVEPEEPIAPFAPSGEALMHDSLTREGRARPVVDAAIRRFARSQTWPELSPDEQYFLRKRLYYGWLLMDGLSPAGSDALTSVTHPEGDDTLDAFEWLLIEVWPTVGVPMWLDEVQRGRAAAGNAVQDAVRR